jgi:2-polyprenyl-6-methoxyphenol hydroxylase-like FAD-dependent oxidoreductase
VIAGHFAAGHGFRGFRDRGLALRRRVLDPLLLERAKAAGARVVEDAHVVDLARDGRGAVEGVVVRGALDGGRTLRAPLVVGADGLRSVVGRRLGVTRRWPWPRRVGVPVSRARARDAARRPRPERRLARPDGRDARRGRRQLRRDRARGRRAHQRGDGRPRRDRAARARRAQVAGGLPRRVDAARAAAPGALGGGGARGAGAVHRTVRQLHARAWAPGAALVGDAADFFDPFTGEGIYSALRGGELLGALRRRGGPRAPGRPRARRRRALAEYERARRRAFRGKWWVERCIALSVARPALMNRAARVLSRHGDMADLLVGVAGDFVPPPRCSTRATCGACSWHHRHATAGPTAPAAPVPTPAVR